MALMFTKIAELQTILGIDVSNEVVRSGTEDIDGTV